MGEVRGGIARLTVCWMGPAAEMWGIQAASGRLVRVGGAALMQRQLWEWDCTT